MTVTVADLGPVPGDAGFVPPVPAPPWDGVVVADPDAPDPGPEDNELFWPPAGEPRAVTPLGLPYPASTDPVADAWSHVKNLSDAIVNLLKAPGQNWGSNVTTANQYGGIWVYAGGLSTIQTYQLQSGYRGGTTTGYFFLFVLGGTWNTTAITATLYSASGGAPLPNIICEHSFTGIGAPG